MEYVYLTALFVLLFSATRIVFKEQGGYGLILPSVLVVIAGNILFTENLPEVENIIILIVILISLLFRVIFKTKE